jgi:hypothetical protein
MMQMFSLISMSLCLLSCRTPQTTEDVVLLLQQAIKAPQQAMAICSKIEATSRQEECLFTAAIQLKNSPALREKVCNELTGKSHGECLFMLAEESNNPTLCAQATPFELDCRLHIFSLRSGRYHTLKDLLQLATSLEMDLNNHNVQTLVYREALSRTPHIPINRCQEANDQQYCVEIARKLYRDILSLSKREGTFPCQGSLGRLKHQDHPVLTKEFNAVHVKTCPQPPK